MKFYKLLTWPTLFALLVQSAPARVGSYGSNARVNVQNRSNVNVNRNTNVNRNVNVNVNRNVNVDVHGGVVYHDNSWNWGSFAAGAAAGAVTTAVVAAATRPSTTIVVAAPAIGAVVTALPTGCAFVSAGVSVYRCANVYYRPYYQGAALVYQVVTYP